MLQSKNIQLLVRILFCFMDADASSFSFREHEPDIKAAREELKKFKKVKIV